MLEIPSPSVPAREAENCRLDWSGAYFWWLQRDSISHVFSPDMIENIYTHTIRPHGDHLLLYLGIAEGQTVFERVVQKHLGHSAGNSTFRHSVGSLIANTLGWQRLSTSTAGKFAVASARDLEVRITKFLFDNAMLSFIHTDSPCDVEGALLGRYRELSLPLNITRNRTHPFCSTLRALRKRYARY